jgi:hypothetical protein
VYSFRDTGSWQGSIDQPGQTSGKPTTVTDRYGRIDLFVPGTNNLAYYCIDTTRVCGGWGQLSSDGIQASDVAAIATNPGNSDDEFWRDSSAFLWHAWNLGGGESHLGTLVGTPSVITGQNNIDVFVRWSSNVIYHQWYGTSWGPSQTTYESMGNAPWSVVY